MPETRERPDATASARVIVRRRREPNPRHRLVAAFDALDALPALGSARERLLAELDASDPDPAAIVGAVESDLALTIRLMREANRTGRVYSLVEAVRVLWPATIRDLAATTPTLELLGHRSSRARVAERMRLHAITTRRVADRLAEVTSYKHRDRVVVTALLHDIGKLVLADAYPAYPDLIPRDARTPEERLHHERRELVIDHALIGGALARRWGLPESIAGAIERHHATDARGDAAYVRLADMIAHVLHGDRISLAPLRRTAAAVGLGSPSATRGRARRALTARLGGPRECDACH